MAIIPNPNSGSFLLNISLAESMNLSVEIADVTGRLVYARELGKVSGNISQPMNASLSKGIYFLMLKANGKQAVQKLVIDN